MPTSRALAAKEGDQQSRAELLGKLLSAAGEKTYILRHGADKTATHLIMASVTNAEASELQRKTRKPPVVVSLGKLTLVPLQLEPELAPGQVQDRLYKPDKGRWTASIALMPLR